MNAERIQVLMAIAELGGSGLSRDAIQQATGLEIPDLAILLSDLKELGLISGTDVAEEDGPIVHISLTMRGRDVVSAAGEPAPSNTLIGF
jgi:DNA-binding MarR family transcriptional regulator